MPSSTRIIVACFLLTFGEVFAPSLGVGQDSETFIILQTEAAPAPSTGIKKMYSNDKGSFFLGGSRGLALYEYEGEAYFSRLKFVKPCSLVGGGLTDQGFVYRDVTDPFYLFFSAISFPSASDGQPRYRLYYSFDGQSFTRWLTASGTRSFELNDAALTEFVSFGSGTGGGNPPGGVTPGAPPSTTTAPDGRKTVFPISESESVDGGRADVTVLPEGIVKIQMKGRHSGNTGSTRYSCSVIISGYKDGEEFVILNRVDTETLTVGANALAGTATKTKSFTQSNAFSTDDRYNIRNVRVLLGKEISGQTFLEAVKNMLDGANQIFDETEALYKKIKESEIGEDVATAVASGG